MNRELLYRNDLSNIDFDNITNEYHNELNKLVDMNNKSFLENKNITVKDYLKVIDWIFEIMYKRFTAPEYFLSLSILKKYMIDNKDIKIGYFQAYACASMINALKIENNETFKRLERFIYEMFAKLTDNTYTAEFLKALTEKYKDIKIATTYDYLHFYNEMLWKEVKLPINKVVDLYTDMISLLKVIDETITNKNSLLAYVAFKYILDENNILS